MIIRESTLPELRQNSRVQPWRHRPFFDDAFPKTLPLLHRTRWRLVETPNQANYPADPGIADLKSDTGQLRWHGADRDRGRVVIDATRVQGLVGFQGDERNRGYAGTELISVDLRNEFAAVVLASLDDQPIRSSKRMLLLVGDRSANQDLTWQDDGETVANWGEGPVVIRRVEGVIRIAGWNASRTPRVTVLDSLGCRTDETWPAEYRGGRWHITAGSPPGLMALIER